MDNKNHLAGWLALLHTPKLGPATVFKILESFSSPTELFATSRAELLARGLSEALVNHLQNPNWQAVEKSLVWATQEQHHIITWQDADYPLLLKETKGAPLVLYVCGDPKILSTTSLAMVGSRKPTPTGLDIAYQFAQHLSAQDFTITSGLALGIDAASHQGALAGKGQTIAVMGAGLNQIYPARHKTLAEQIIDQGGALVSEFPPDTLPKAEHFPRRNRIISGLSLGTLVVEAAVQSGSLITAKYALEQGREVFAVPGSIHNPLARGCHVLLKQGAKLVETVEDILEEFSNHLPCRSQIPSQNDMIGEIRFSKLQLSRDITVKKCTKLDYQDAKIVECVGFETTSIDTLIERSSLGAEVVSARLLMLELQGYVLAVPGGYVRKAA